MKNRIIWEIHTLFAGSAKMLLYKTGTLTMGNLRSSFSSLSFIVNRSSTSISNLRYKADLILSTGLFILS